MRSVSCRMRLLPALVAGLAGGILATASGPAEAGWFYRDHAYADSFGNLVIYSPAGYKRIIVGQGHRAREFSDFSGFDTDAPGDLGPEYGREILRDCYNPPLFLMGRSYMYGLADGEMPTIFYACR